MAVITLVNGLATNDMDMEFTLGQADQNMRANTCMIKDMVTVN